MVQKAQVVRKQFLKDSLGDMGQNKQTITKILYLQAPSLYQEEDSERELFIHSTNIY